MAVREVSAVSYSMALSAELEAAGHTPTSVSTTAGMYLERDGGGFSIVRVEP